MPQRIRSASTKWGFGDDETCVIELSSLAAHDSAVQLDPEEFKAHRVATIRDRILRHQPRFAVVYGKKNQAERFSEVGRLYD